LQLAGKGTADENVCKRGTNNPQACDDPSAMGFEGLVWLWAAA